MHQFYIIFYTKNIFSSCWYIEENFKNNEIYQKFFGESAVRLPGKRGNVPLIHPMSYKPQIFTNVVLQCLVDKDVITYQNIWTEGKVRPYEAIVTLGDYRRCYQTYPISCIEYIYGSSC